MERIITLLACSPLDAEHIEVLKARASEKLPQLVGVHHSLFNSPKR